MKQPEFMPGFLKFLAKAHRSTYAAPAEVKAKTRVKPPLIPGGTTYVFREGDWEYVDQYHGSFDAPGAEIVNFSGNTIWRMTYEGLIDSRIPEKEVKEEIWPFLGEALMTFPGDFPFRGPKRFEKGEFVYTFDAKWDVPFGQKQPRLKGRESILRNGKEVFFQEITGTFVR
ncbi:MAG: DUF5680 domain-containing protein [Candidatus Woesearchaeota archaeon]